MRRKLNPAALYSRCTRCTGAIVEVEEATELASVPEAARKALEFSASPGKVLKVESVTNDAVVSYEAVIEKNGKKSEIAVTNAWT